MEKINYAYIEHTVVKQKQAEDAILAEFHAGNYTLEQPLVQLNPYLIAPLTAMVLFSTATPVEAEIRVLGKTKPADVVHTFPAATEHILPVYGLYDGYSNTVEITLSDGRKNSVTIQTPAAPAKVKRCTKIMTTPEYMGQDMMALTVAMNATPTVYDYAGDVRWYSPQNFNFDLKRLKNGHILIGSDRYMGAHYYTSGVIEMAFSGKIFTEYKIPGGYHHDQFEMEDGSLLILTQDLTSDTVEDMCVQVDRESGEILRTWDYKTFLPQYPVAGSGSQDEKDWFHNNAVWYDKKTNSLTLSGRHQDAIVNIDFESGKLNWILGDPEGWPQEMVEQYFFKPVGDTANFDWQYEQHACVVCPNGDIMCFDNGHYRAKNKEHYILGKDNFSRGVRYHIDTEKMEIEQVWQYGKERGNAFFSPYICNVEYYADGHYLVHSGGIAWLHGETPEGLGSQLARKNPDVELESITVEVQDGQVLYEMHTPANYYRAEKLQLYYENETAELGSGRVIGHLGVTPTTKMKVRAEKTGQLVPASYAAKVEEEADRMIFYGRFEAGTMVQVLLQDEQGNLRRYPVKTTTEEFQAMCVGTFQKADEKAVDKYINKEGLAGTYQVSVLIDDKIYETGVEITA